MLSLPPLKLKATRWDLRTRPTWVGEWDSHHSHGLAVVGC